MKSSTSDHFLPLLLVIWGNNVSPRHVSYSSYSSRCIAGLHQEIRDAIPQLIELLKDESSVVRSSATVALGKLGDQGQL